MTMPNQRRRDPQPLGQSWELAVVVLSAALLGLALAALLGLGAAAALFGGGWVWPHGTDTIRHVLGGLLAAHPGRGLPARQVRQVAAPVPTYLCVLACEVALIGLLAWAGVLIARYRRLGDARGGMATRTEAKQALGQGRLRGARDIIRPDLHGLGRERRSLRR
ncbi:MAG TPA: hypothetical protein VGL39_24905 [Jatrophihabitantaceae bacterium]|jgi:hypothetical protein